MKHTLNWVGNTSPSSRKLTADHPLMLGAPHRHLLPCAKCLPRHPPPQTPCHISSLFRPASCEHQPTTGGQAEWQIPLKQSRGGFRTPGEGAQQLIFGEQRCACWGWFVSICLVWSSAVTMAWHAAKRLLPLIAVSSYVRALLTGGIYDTEDRAAGLGLYDNNSFKKKTPGSIQNAFPFVYISRKSYAKRIHTRPGMELFIHSFRWIITGNPCNSILNSVPR